MDSSSPTKSVSKKPKPPPKPPGLGSRRDKSKTDSPPVSRLRLHFARVFSLRGGSTSQPPSPTVPPARMAFSSSCESLALKQASPGGSPGAKTSPKTRRSLGSVSSEPGPEVVTELTPSPNSKRRVHWRSKSDTAKVMRLLRNKQQGVVEEGEQVDRSRRHATQSAMLASKKGASPPASTTQQQPPRPATPSGKFFASSGGEGGSWHRIFRLPRLLLSTAC